MNKQIYSRLAALAEEIRRRQEIQKMPVDQLSRSLTEFADELSELDDLGKAALLAELNRGDDLDGSMGLDLSREALDAIIADYCQGLHTNII